MSVFCDGFSFCAVEAIKLPAPHSEKQIETIAIFAIQFMLLAAYLPSLSPEPARGGAGK